MSEDNYDAGGSLWCMRIVGGITALSELAKVTQCMRLDKPTVALLETARAALNKAVLSAWEYADSQASGEVKPKCFVCDDTGKLPGGSGPSCDGICRDCSAADAKGNV